MFGSAFVPSRSCERLQAGRRIAAGVLLLLLTLAGAHAGETHSLEAQLEPWAGASRPRFGESLAIDGATAVVAMPGFCDADVGCDGGAFVFELEDGTWAESALLREGGSDVLTATNVALSGDRLLVGAPRTGELGVAFVYRLCRSTTGIQDTCDSPGEGNNLAWIDHEGS